MSNAKVTTFATFIGLSCSVIFAQGSFLPDPTSGGGGGTFGSGPVLADPGIPTYGGWNPAWEQYLIPYPSVFTLRHGLDTAFAAVYSSPELCLPGNAPGVVINVTRQLLPTWPATFAGLTMAYPGDSSKVSTLVEVHVYRSRAGQTLYVYLNSRLIGTLSDGFPGGVGWFIADITVPNNLVRWMSHNDISGEAFPAQNTVQILGGSDCTSLNYAYIQVTGPQSVIAVHGMNSSGVASFGGFENEFRANGNPVFFAEVPQPTLPQRVTTLQYTLALFGKLTGLWNVHLVGHSAGGLTIEGAYSKAYTAWLPQPASVQTLGSPFQGSPVADYFVNRQIATVDKTSLGNLPAVSAGNLGAILSVIGTQAQVIAGLKTDVRLGVSAAAWPRLPKMRWPTVSSTPQKVFYGTYSADAAAGGSPVDTSGFPITSALANGLYNFVGQTQSTSVQSEQVCNPNGQCSYVRVQLAKLRVTPEGDDLIVPQSSSNPPMYPVAMAGAYANHLDMRAALQSVVASQIFQNDTPVFVEWLMVRY